MPSKQQIKEWEEKYLEDPTVCPICDGELTVEDWWHGQFTLEILQLTKCSNGHEFTESLILSNVTFEGEKNV
jgi:hypothetical protein